MGQPAQSSRTAREGAALPELFGDGGAVRGREADALQGRRPDPVPDARRPAASRGPALPARGRGFVRHYAYSNSKLEPLRFFSKMIFF